MSQRFNSYGIMYKIMKSTYLLDNWFLCRKRGVMSSWTFEERIKVSRLRCKMVTGSTKINEAGC